MISREEALAGILHMLEDGNMTAGEAENRLRAQLERDLQGPVGQMSEPERAGMCAELLWQLTAPVELAMPKATEQRRQAAARLYLRRKKRRRRAMAAAAALVFAAALPLISRMSQGSETAPTAQWELTAADQLGGNQLVTAASQAGLKALWTDAWLLPDTLKTGFVPERCIAVSSSSMEGLCCVYVNPVTGEYVTLRRIRLKGELSDSWWDAPGETLLLAGREVRAASSGGEWMYSWHREDVFWELRGRESAAAEADWESTLTELMERSI